MSSRDIRRSDEMGAAGRKPMIPPAASFVRACSHRRAVVAGAIAVVLSSVSACSSPPTLTPIPEAPRLACAADVAVVSADGGSVAVEFPPPQATGGEPPILVGCTPLSGTSFAPGTTPVICTANDHFGRSATCGFSVVVTVPPKLRYTRFVAFGDSITAGKLATISPMFQLFEDYPVSYPSRLEGMLSARYSMQTFTVFREGVSGEDTEHGVLRLPGTLSLDRPEVLLLMHGANDLFGGDATKVAPAIHHLDQMIGVAKSAGVTVFLATLPPQREGGFRARGFALVAPFNAGIRSLAASTGATLVDVHEALSADVASYIGPDGLHPTDAGYEKMAETFFSAIQATLEERAAAPSGIRAAPARPATAASRTPSWPR